jgi:hypothetical protein
LVEQGCGVQKRVMMMRKIAPIMMGCCSGVLWKCMRLELLGEKGIAARGTLYGGPRQGRRDMADDQAVDRRMT